MHTGKQSDLYLNRQSNDFLQKDKNILYID